MLAALVPRERPSVAASVLLEIVGNAKRELDDLSFELLFVAVPDDDCCRPHQSKRSDTSGPSLRR